MDKKICTLGVSALLALAGCGGAAAPRTASYGGSSGYNSPSAEYSPAPSATMPPSGGAYGEAQPPAPDVRDRPGLGTEWGESRESRVRDVTFLRADPDRPFAIATIHYNDRPGVEALANFHGWAAPRLREFPTGRGGTITISIRDGRGEPFEALKVGDRTYVVGQAGERYSIVLTNHTGHRYEAVATVDGLDVINGRAGTLANRGYVLMPYATLEIDGFRQSTESVAAFRFGKVSDSYAAQTGDHRNVGVIGVAFFNERGDDSYNEDELRTRDGANPFPRDGRFAQPPR